VQRLGVDDGEQIVDLPEPPVGGRYLAGPAPVIRDDVPSVPRPAPTAAQARVQQDDR